MCNVKYRYAIRLKFENKFLTSLNQLVHGAKTSTCSTIKENLLGPVQNKECYFMLSYIFLGFLLFFIIKFVFIILISFFSCIFVTEYQPIRNKNLRSEIVNGTVCCTKVPVN